MRVPPCSSYIVTTIGFIGAVKETSPARSIILTGCAPLTLKSSAWDPAVAGELAFGVFFTTGDCFGPPASYLPAGFDGGFDLSDELFQSLIGAPLGAGAMAQVVGGIDDLLRSDDDRAHGY